MNRMPRNIVVLAVVAMSAAACTRRVQVESEPNRYEAASAVTSAVGSDVAGSEDVTLRSTGRS